MTLGDGFLQDVRWALRSLTRSRAFATIAVLTLALAIGVNSAIFSMVGAILFNDLPIAETDGFSFFFLQKPEQGLRRVQMSMFEYLEYRRGVSALEELAAIREATAILTGIEEPTRVVVSEATPNLWDAWRMEPFLGRGFHRKEAELDAESVAILSHGFWERRFGADPEIVGRHVELDGMDTTIVGVMSPAFEFADMARVEMWRPLRLPATTAPSELRVLFVTGRLASGATLDQARQQAEAVAHRLAQESPYTNEGWMPQIESFTEGLASDDFWPILITLSITVGFVMLMACSNIASMMLARGTARSREIALRAALGAGRLRVVRGLLTEGAVLAVVAALLGLAVTRASLEALVWIAGDNAGISFFFRMLEIDHRVLAFTLLVAALSPLLFSLLPALRVTRTGLVEALKAGCGASGGVDAFRARRVLVAGQVALALSLMVVAGVMVRSLLQVRTMELGYDGSALLTLRVDLPEAKYPAEQQRLQFFRDVRERVRALAEIEQAAWVSRRPIAESAGSERFRVRSRPQEEARREPWAGLVAADPAYFDLMNIRLLRGRMFGPRDTLTAMPVVLVNQDVVTRYFPDTDPVGEYVQLNRDRETDRWMEVIGVVSSLAQPDPTTPSAPLFYVPFEQSPRLGMALVTRPRGATPGTAINAIRRAVLAVDPDQPIGDVRTMRQIFADGIAPMDAIMSMFTAFAGFALVMAAAGIYGVMSVLVTQRTREFGIRMALGADRRTVRSMVIRGSVWLIVGGALAGVVAGFALASFLASAIPEVEPTDPFVYISVSLALTATAFGSLLLPTRRATRVDPLIALRAE